MSKTDPPDDLEILRAQKNDRQALISVVDKTTPYVYSLCKSWARPPLDSGDLTQDSLIKIVENIGKFRRDSEFFTWVYTIVYRTFLDTARKQNRRSKIAPEVHLDSTYDLAGSQPTVQTNELGDALSTALDALDPLHREILILIDVKQNTYEQTARELSIAVGTVRSRVSRARINLRNLLVSQGTFDANGNVLYTED